MDCTGYSFRQLRHYAGHTTPQDAAAYCGVSVSTIRRWDKGHAPPVAIKLYRLLNQDLGVYDRQWRGFRFVDGELVGGRTATIPTPATSTPGAIWKRRWKR